MPAKGKGKKQGAKTQKIDWETEFPGLGGIHPVSTPPPNDGIRILEKNEPVTGFEMGKAGAESFRSF